MLPSRGRHHPARQRRIDHGIHWVPYFVVKLRSECRSYKRDVKELSVEELVSLCDPSPCGLGFNRVGMDETSLRFEGKKAAVDAVVWFWEKRLSGEHMLTPVPCFRGVEELDGRIKLLFLSYIDGLLESRKLKELEWKMAELNVEIDELRNLNAKTKTVWAFDALTERRKARKKELDAELIGIRRRIAEFRRSMTCVRDYIEGRESKEFEVLKFWSGEGLDWNRIQCVLLRECLRLQDGLPIYGFRLEILEKVLTQQVTVLIGETGSGKSTQLVQFLADSGFAAGGSILCIQPRKIAAMSLAKRVKEEAYGCYRGTSIVCYPHYSTSQSLASQVIYMTDHCLLQHLLQNRTLSGVSCILVDEAHERSLNTDLVLALTKGILRERADLRLVVMSATVDSSKLSEYFFGCGSFKMLGRNYPIDIKYVPGESGGLSAPLIGSNNVPSYVSDVVRQTKKIHDTENDGAILAFLTSQTEVEWACENFRSSSAVAIALHGKLSPGEQSRAFQTYRGKRKVIFATNLAETSLTIPGVKYVVDSGLFKESRFEPTSGMNVLRVSRISQGSADQRAGRAGRTMPGKCFRLYSELDFESMPSHQDPEICKVHLGIAILRILALGISNILEFDFVDAPNPQSIDMAIRNLVLVGAVNYENGVLKLTHDGHLLVKLGIEPRLGKIILEGIRHGLHREAVVLAAVMANASSIFCRVGTDEDKLKSDSLKVQFCHQDGDLFTFLSVYQEWEKVPPVDRNKWCWSNCVNAKTMRRCQETILELENCLKHDLSTNVPTEWHWSRHAVSASDTALKKIILSALADNIAVYSGYDRLGYEVVASGEYFQLHPSCSLHIYGQKPNWVVFSEVLSISSQYLVCVTAVDFESISLFAPPLFDVFMVESRKLHSKVISGFGSTLLKRFCGRSNSSLHSLLSRMQSIFMDKRIGMEVNVDNNEVKLFASPQDIEKVYDMAIEYLNYEMKWLANECLDRRLYRGGRSGAAPPLALFGAGAEIKHLELDNRNLAVDVSFLNANFPDDKEILTFFEKCVSGVSGFSKFSTVGQENDDLKKWGRVVFLSPEAASKALELSGVELSGSSLNLFPAQSSIGGGKKSSNFSAVKAKIVWPRRYSRGYAIVRCRPDDVEYIIDDCSGVLIGGRFIQCERSTKGIGSIVVRGLDVGTSEPEILEALQSASSRIILDVFLIRGGAVGDPSLDACEEALLKEIASFIPSHRPLSNYCQVQVFPPEPKDSYMRASVTFDGKLHLEAARALQNLQGKVLPGRFSWQKIECQQTFNTSLSCPAFVYSFIKQELNLKLKRVNSLPGVSCSLERNENGSYRVKVTANATKKVAELRRPLEQVMNGKLVINDRLTRAVLQLLFSRDGTMLMKSIEQDLGTCILFDRQNCNVRLFGPENKIGLTEQKLVEGLLNLHDNKQRNICLRRRGMPPDLLKRVVENFGPNLHELKEKFPETEFKLNTRQQVIYYSGNADTYSKIDEVIHDFVRSVCVSGSPEQQETDDSACPICLCEIEDCYQLEACGHRFCRSCLVDQLDSATKGQDIPVCCTQKDCMKQILLTDLKSLLTPEKLDDLFRASLAAFVASSGGTYRFCPSPDCPSIYRVTKDQTVGGHFLCGACYAETCTSCQLEYHPFVSCERYKEFKNDPDTSLKDWCKDKDNVKSCPLCGYMIEKIEGCNHVECRCGKHICWVCLATFSNSGECYAHLTSVHQAIV